MQPRDRLVLALDVPDLARARALLDAVGGQVGVIKIGLELFIAEGAAAIALVRAAGLACFLDLKLHDIPATVGRASRAAAAQGAEYLTVHASAGPRALDAAVEATRGSPTRLLAVTVLTSHDATELAAMGYAEDSSALVHRRAELARDAGIDGFVCSVHEAAAMRRIEGLAHARLVCPGVRPAGSAPGDQRRVATPSEAIAAGADLIVVGRPIRDAADPGAAARAIVEELAG